MLRDVSLFIAAGECVAVVGENGSGKSTLLKIVAGLLRPSKGVVQIGDATESADRRARVAYSAPDLSFYPELSARENLEFFARVAGWDANPIPERLASVGLGKRMDDHVAVFSSGMRQRLRLAFAALHTRADVLLLDEPSLALDEAGVALVVDLIHETKARGAAVLLATNDPREKTLGDRTVALASQ